MSHYRYVWPNKEKLKNGEFLVLVGKKVFTASSVKKMSRFAEVSPDEINWELLETLLKQLFFSDLPTASLVIYISSYPARPRRITVNYARIWTIANNQNTLQGHRLQAVCNILYNKPSYSRILIGFRLWSIRGQMHRWRQCSIQVFWNFEFEPITIPC